MNQELRERIRDLETALIDSKTSSHHSSLETARQLSQQVDEKLANFEHNLVAKLNVPLKATSAF